MARNQHMPSVPQHPYGRPEQGWRRRLYDVVFGTETRAGRAFDARLPRLRHARPAAGCALLSRLRRAVATGPRADEWLNGHCCRSGR